jgi:hypothetical protein
MELRTLRRGIGDDVHRQGVEAGRYEETIVVILREVEGGDVGLDRALICERVDEGGRGGGGFSRI